MLRRVHNQKKLKTSEEHAHKVFFSCKKERQNMLLNRPLSVLQGLPFRDTGAPTDEVATCHPGPIKLLFATQGEKNRILRHVTEAFNPEEGSCGFS